MTSSGALIADSNTVWVPTRRDVSGGLTVLCGGNGAGIPMSKLRTES
jgi:hypothetical protein